jgi:hypothetical protein
MGRNRLHCLHHEVQENKICMNGVNASCNSHHFTLGALMKSFSMTDNLPNPSGRTRPWGLLSI